ncbi:MAG: hypothetical protein WCH83_05305 [Alphaproteobacteria bacterium]|jgi:hypothetical protein
MGEVLRFPLERRRALPPDGAAQDREATIMILPVVRIERQDDRGAPPDEAVAPRRGGPGKRRRKSA